MVIIQYLLTIIIASVSGIIWSIVFVNFVPKWYESLPYAIGLALFLIPAVVHFLCGALLHWWGSMHCLLYIIIVLGWWLSGVVRNEMEVVGNLGHIDFTSGAELVSYLVIGGILAGSWKMGRMLRALAIRRIGN